MPTCGQCSSAIASLVVQYVRLLPSFKASAIMEPIRQFVPKEAKNCWICAKFLVWLEVKHQDLFRVRYSMPLVTKFSILGLLLIKDPQTEMISFDLDLDIVIEGTNENVERCPCNVHLVPEKGIFHISK
jgi:hypothetical protein